MIDSQEFSRSASYSKGESYFKFFVDFLFLFISFGLDGFEEVVSVGVDGYG